MELTRYSKPVILNKLTHRKRGQICVYQRQGGLNEGGQKVQSFSYEKNKY